jgi:hypothetical protein
MVVLAPDSIELRRGPPKELVDCTEDPHMIKSMCDEYIARQTREEVRTNVKSAGGVNPFDFDPRTLRPARKKKPKPYVTLYPPRRCKGTLTIRPSKGFRADRGVVYVGNTQPKEAALWMR